MQNGTVDDLTSGPSQIAEEAKKNDGSVLLKQYDGVA